jgi:hypothetical protein
MIDTYFTELEHLLQQFVPIRSYSLKKKVYNSKYGCIIGTILFEDGTRLDFMEVKNTDKPGKVKYRYHYMTSQQELIFRYDNAPHHPQLKTFPHHKHLPQGEQESGEPTLEAVLLEIARYERETLPEF